MNGYHCLTRTQLTPNQCLAGGTTRNQRCPQPRAVRRSLPARAPHGSLRRMGDQLALSTDSDAASTSSERLAPLTSAIVCSLRYGPVRGIFQPRVNREPIPFLREFHHQDPGYGEFVSKGA